MEIEQRRKLDPTTRKAIFLGYPETQTGFIIMDVDTGRIHQSRTFFCDEEQFADRVQTQLLAATGEILSEDLANFDVQSENIDDFGGFENQSSKNRNS